MAGGTALMRQGLAARSTAAAVYWRPYIYCRRRPFEGGAGLVGKDEYEQTRQIFSRIDRIIKAAGGTMDDLIKMTIYVVDIKNNTEVWRARREFFTGDFPASTLVEVRSLAKPEVLVEIEVVAYLGKS